MLAALPMPAAYAATLRTLTGTSILGGETCPVSSVSTCLSVGVEKLSNHRTIGVVAEADGRVRTVPGTGDLTAVACTSATRCVAIGGSPTQPGGLSNSIIVPLSSGGIGSIESLPTSYRLLSIACWDSSCMAVGGYNDNDGSYGALALPVSPAGDQGPAIEVPSTSSDSVGFSAVSCPDADECLAAGENFDLDAGSDSAYIAAISDGVITQTATDGLSEYDPLQAISCTSAATCLGVGTTSTNQGSEPFVLPIDPTVGTFGSLAAIPVNGYGSAVSCTVTDSCIVAIGTTSDSNNPGTAALYRANVDGVIAGGTIVPAVYGFLGVSTTSSGYVADGFEIEPDGVTHEGVIVTGSL